ncbi:MAG: TIGR03936 family radical SAM-associated protein [Fimbriiglobus sp.]
MTETTDNSTGDKFRLRFRKAGDLRLLSHLDLMRCGERLLRRAELPFKMTGGFHPTPRFVFALSLPLGVEGLDEVVELEVTRPLAAADVLDRFNRHAPPGLTFHAISVVPMKASAFPRRVTYTFPLPPELADDVAAKCRELLATGQIWVDKLHPRPRRVNVRPYIRGMGVVCEAPPPAHQLSLDFWVTGQGSARAEDILTLLGLRHLLDAGAVLARNSLELHDETPAGSPDGPPEGPPETRPLDHVPALAAGGEDDTAARATWGLSPNGPVVE